MFDFIRGLLSGTKADGMGVLVDRFNNKLKPVMQTKELGSALRYIKRRAVRGQTVCTYTLYYDSDVDVLVQQLEARGFSCDPPQRSIFGISICISW